MKRHNIHIQWLTWKIANAQHCKQPPPPPLFSHKGLSTRPMLAWLPCDSEPTSSSVGIFFFIKLKKQATFLWTPVSELNNNNITWETLPNIKGSYLFTGVFTDCKKSHAGSTQSQGPVLQSGQTGCSWQTRQAGHKDSSPAPLHDPWDRLLGVLLLETPT